MNRSYVHPLAAIATGALLSAWIAAPAVAADYASTPAGKTTAKEEFLSMQHEFQLESGEKLMLSHRHEPTTYRICVDTFTGAVPLKVLTDQKESTVAVASCETVEGKHLSVEPAANLPGGEYLVGRFRKVEK